MSIFEIQIVSDGRWKVSHAFEDFDAAYECADRIERKELPEQLRIRRVDMIRPGIMRERTMYDGGQKVRREKSAERKAEEQEAFRRRIADRRIQRNLLETAGKTRKPLFSSNSPLYLTLVSLTIGLTGLSALYLVERAFTS